MKKEEQNLMKRAYQKPFLASCARLDAQIFATSEKWKFCIKDEYDDFAATGAAPATGQNSTTITTFGEDTYMNIISLTHAN